MNSYNAGIPELIIIATIYLTTSLQSLIVAGAISGGPVVIPTYLAYVKGAYASEARTVISNISNASKMYYQIKGEWPADVDALEIEGQLDLVNIVKVNDSKRLFRYNSYMQNNPLNVNN